MCRLCFLVLVGMFLGCGLLPAKEDLGDCLKDGSFWQDSSVQARVFQGEYFSWVERGTRARLIKPTFTVCSLRAGETLLDLENGNVVRVRVSLYNRGDDDAKEREAFLRDIEAARVAIDRALGVPGQEYRGFSGRAVVRTRGYTWTTPQTDVLLEYSLSQNAQPEFIRLSLVPAGKLSSLMQTHETVEKKKRSEYRENVTTTPEGEVIINNVPMEDQGQKGYCAAATVARLLRYYGNDNTDQHQVAQLAKSDAGSGTQYHIMMEAIAKVLPSKFGLRVSYLEPGENDQKWIADYNKEARRKRKDPLPKNISAAALWAKVDPQVLLDARAGKTETRRWLRTVSRYVDRGVPVMWGVMLGVYPDQDGGSMQRTATPSGHLRLIIGYNEKKDEVIYTDSWGAGHERKTMPLRTAVAMTTSLGVILP